MVSRHNRYAKRRPQTAQQAETDVLDTQSIERRLRRVSRWRYPSWQDWVSLSETDKLPRSRPQVNQRSSPGFPQGQRKHGEQAGRSIPSWGVSAGIHGLLIICLALLSIANKGMQRRELVICSPTTPHLPDSPALLKHPYATISPQPHWRAATREAEQSPNPVTAADMAPQLPWAEHLSKQRRHLFNDAQTLFRAGGIGSTPTAAAAPQSNSTHFFGVPGNGSRFVFVVDSSRSMMGSDFSGRPWKHAQHELQMAISRLGPSCQFYVIFFDGKAHLMFDETPASMNMLHASSENVARFTHWMTNVQTGFNTSPLQAVKCALSIRPDVIYLLSDGEFRDQTARYLKRNNRRTSTTGKRAFASIVHTIGFHNRAAQRVLRNIANSNGGTYKFVADPFTAARLTGAE
ncbi:MAG: VWA domain-containing protein [Planctomycetota bacterium]|nr:VWA domain-containing protein [Planctomycetota bacterium]